MQQGAARQRCGSRKKLAVLPIFYGCRNPAERPPLYFSQYLKSEVNYKLVELEKLHARWSDVFVFGHLFLRNSTIIWPIFFSCGFSICCLATASPAKFPEAIEKSGLIMENPRGIQDLFALEEKFSDMKLGQDWERILRDKIVSVYR